MRFRIDRNDERPIYVQIIDEVRSSIMRGLLKPGDRLPPVRKLAEQLNINLHTVRRAYSMLSEHKIVSCRRGAGTIVQEDARKDDLLRRDQLLRDIATRALRSANRHGFPVEELVGALRRVDMTLTPAAWIAPPTEAAGFRRR